MKLWFYYNFYACVLHLTLLSYHKYIINEQKQFCGFNYVHKMK